MSGERNAEPIPSRTEDGRAATRLRAVGETTVKECLTARAAERAWAPLRLPQAALKESLISATDSIIRMAGRFTSFAQDARAEAATCKDRLHVGDLSGPTRTVANTRRARSAR
jgi:hypothetical protein